MHSTISHYRSPINGRIKVMVLNATFNNISAISWRSVYWCMKPEYTEKTIDLPQFTDKLYHIMVYGVRLAMSGIGTRDQPI